MSFFTKGIDALKQKVSNLSNAGTMLHFGDTQVVTTALLAEGGYSYVYHAREVGVSARVFAAKKVLAQDADTRDVAEVETRCLQQFDGHPAFVRCFGAVSKSLPNRSVEHASARSPTREAARAARTCSHTHRPLFTAARSPTAGTGCSSSSARTAP
jgi:hypothetical protein